MSDKYFYIPGVVIENPPSENGIFMNSQFKKSIV